ncbi:MAG: ABC transporter ATP-binding protein [Planctomycetes bacterium]|nr:ABC transporter ATP-binding protein [Planctomycetota bacterium]
MPPLLTTEGLCKNFGRLRAVDGLRLCVEDGDLYGFLGLNGAGKTTTIRMVMGLIRPTAGNITLLGRPLPASFLEVMPQVGAMVEIPAFYPYLSGLENLRLLARFHPGADLERCEQVLKSVGLFDRRHDRVRGYSQGMRQRLGIAQALLHRPRIVILDEPTNGLDPEGIQEIRAFLRRLNREEGVTLVLSSHLLHEVEMLCTRVGIIREGRLVVEERIETLLGESSREIRLRAEPKDLARRALEAFGGARILREEADGAWRVECDPARYGALNAALVGAGVEVRELSPQRRTLEDFFLSVAGSKPAEGAAA